jgi:galactose mutarotase-like enzyme
MAEPLLIGGLPVVTLAADPAPDRPSVVEATVLPGRGFMLLQAVVAMPDGARVDALVAPSPEAAAHALDGGPDDFAGNKSFSFGGAILAPYANRIRGRAVEGRREIETVVGGRPIRLPRNWGGKAPGAETYAMHGLILAAPATFEQPSRDRVIGRLPPEAFAGWPGRIALDFEWRLAEGGLRLQLQARNLGDQPAPFGAGWHPYLRLPGGDRRSAQLRAPATLRCEVNGYDEVLPTGRLLPVAGTAYDFSGARPLKDLYLDDCFTGLPRNGGALTAEIYDPVAGLGLRVASSSPAVKALQVYAPLDQPYVCLEPQFNLADPFGPEWPRDVDTGMQRLEPGAATAYEVELSAFCPDQPRP